MSYKKQTDYQFSNLLGKKSVTKADISDTSDGSSHYNQMPTFLSDST